jgi:hypothetical protein
MIFYDVTIKNLDEISAAIADRRRWQRSRALALGKATSRIEGKVYDWIMSGGEETWPGFHPLTRLFQKAPGGAWTVRSRFLNRSNWNWLVRHVSSWTSRSGYVSSIQFGGSGKMAARALEIERGGKIKVTDSVRRLMGATRPKNRKAVIGTNFFPLRKSTIALSLPARRIMAPVAKKYAELAVRAFETEFFKRFNLDTPR